MTRLRVSESFHWSPGQAPLRCQASVCVLVLRAFRHARHLFFLTFSCAIQKNHELNCVFITLISLRSFNRLSRAKVRLHDAVDVLQLATRSLFKSQVSYLAAFACVHPVVEARSFVRAHPALEVEGAAALILASRCSAHS